MVDYYILNNYGIVFFDQYNMMTSEVIENVDSGLSSEEDVEISTETAEGLIDFGVNIDKQIELLENKNYNYKDKRK